MEVSVFTEAYINNSTDVTISNSNKAILCRKVLEKYNDILLQNPNGCIFKISYTHSIMQTYFECYVSCIEFTAPDNSMFISNENFDKMCLVLEDKVNIELFNPPQASNIVFTIKDRVIKNIEDIKCNLENLINSKYKFLYENQEIPFLDDKIIVKKIEPYAVCLVNNTDLNVEFDIIKTIEKVAEIKPDDVTNIYESNALDNNSEQVVNEIEEKSPETITIPELSIEELRQKRLDYFLKK